MIEVGQTRTAISYSQCIFFSFEMLFLKRTLDHFDQSCDIAKNLDIYYLEIESRRTSICIRRRPCLSLFLQLLFVLCMNWSAI